MTARLVVFSPAGPLTLTETDGALTGVRFGAGAGEETRTLLLMLAEKELGGYFAGALRSFSVPLAYGGTPFFRDCMRALLQVPYGRTVTYAELAAMAGRPGAARAAGNACRHNPLPLFIPCHRVVSAAGTGGYAGNADGMIEIKKQLLALESGGR